jgi:hypothetical protein
MAASAAAEEPAPAAPNQPAAAKAPPAPPAPASESTTTSFPSVGEPPPGASAAPSRGELPPLPPAAPAPATQVAPPAGAAGNERAPASSAASPAQPPPLRHTQGLFEERPGAEVHHYRDEPDDDDDADHFKIGPVVGAGVPSLLSVGGTMKVTRFLGAGINLGLIPRVSLTYYGDATLSYKHVDFYGRIYPFGGGLFLGAGAGYATVQGTLDKSFALSSVGLPGTVSYESRGSVRTLMLTAVLGYFYTFDIGLSFGLDAGAQIPIAPSRIEFASDVTGDLPTAVRSQIKETYLDPNDREVRDTLERIGRTTLPTVNFRIGWIL